MQESQAEPNLANASARATFAKRSLGPRPHHMRLEKALALLPGVKPIAGADAIVAVYYHLKELAGRVGAAAPVPAVKFFTSVLVLEDFLGVAAADDFATRCMTPKGARQLVRLYEEGAFERHRGVRGRSGRPMPALNAFAALAD